MKSIQLFRVHDGKWEEVMAFETTTHPIEFDMYYSV